MEQNFSHADVKINQEIFNQTIEQPLELEYLLPDYCTGIFKMLQFKTKPHICSFRSSGDQITIDGNTTIKLIYIDEDAGDVKSIHQIVPFSKTVKLNDAIKNPCVFYDIKTNYANCKIISSKKIDVKGSLTIFIKIYDQVNEPVMQKLTDEETKKTGIHFKQQPVKMVANQLWNNQQFKISEQIEFDAPIEEILDVKINIIENEHKPILNKIISKATAYLTIIYCSSDKKTILNKKISASINQILEMPNINENYICNVDYDVSTINSKLLQDNKILKIEADGLINGYASISKTIELVSDAFSTKFNLNPTTKTFETYDISAAIKENFSLTETFESVNFNKIIDIDAQISDLNNQINGNQIEFNGKLTLNVYGLSNDETPESIDKSVPISFKIKKLNSNNLNSKEKVNVKIFLSELDFEIGENQNLNLKLNFQINGLITSISKINIIDSIEIDEKEIKPKTDAAITLFYPQKHDNVWNIAKRFSTCPKEIMEANGLTSEIIEDEVMLIIPII